jgi:hypothetical protein
VSHSYLLAICFAPSLADSFIILTLTRLVVVFIFVNFSFALFTPPLGDFQIPLRYPHISKRTPLLSVPLGKSPVFDGEDYNMWSDKMRHHLTSLHTSIWNVVEFGVQVPSIGDEDYDSDEVAQIQHFNSQVTTILLASLSREEYNKVQGLKSAKEIWDVLKTAHEGDEVTKITKRETIEGELGRFMLHQGEDLQAMYNHLKTLVKQVRNLGSTK